MKVGIIGAGTMGSGIAQAFAQVEGIFVFDPDKLIADPEAYKHYSLESGDLQSNDIRAIIRVSGPGCIMP